MAKLSNNFLNVLRDDTEYLNYMLNGCPENIFKHTLVNPEYAKMSAEMNQLLPKAEEYLKQCLESNDYSESWLKDTIVTSAKDDVQTIKEGALCLQVYAYHTEVTIPISDLGIKIYNSLIDQWCRQHNIPNVFESCKLDMVITDINYHAFTRIEEDEVILLPVLAVTHCGLVTEYLKRR